MGRISHLYAQEGDSVKEGQLLAELDSTDLLAQKKQIVAAKLQTEASKLQAQAKYDYDVKNIKVLQIGLERAKEDFDRVKIQYKGDVVTKEQFDHSKKALETAQAQYDASQAQLTVSQSQIKTAEAAIVSAEAQVGNSEHPIRKHSPLCSNQWHHCQTLASCRRYCTSRTINIYGEQQSEILDYDLFGRDQNGWIAHRSKGLFHPRHLS